MARGISAFCAGLSLLISVQSLSAYADSVPKVEGAAECEAALSSEKVIKAAGENFEKFFAGIGTQLFEREFFLKIARLALLSKEHVLMIGPPGTAKSMGVDLIIDNIVDATTGENSVYKIQMTPETSLSETHGVIDYKKITEENIQTRKWEQGLLSAKLAFIDEFFDARANAIRNNLMALNEREHAQGRERIKGHTETGFAATNKYIHEVYEKAGDDGPKAIIDRFAFVAFVPGELNDVKSALALIQESPVKRPSKITFQELDLLRAKVNEVKIPDYVARMLTLVFSRMKQQTEGLEESEKKRFIEQKKSGLTPLPPYRSTKYYSARTLRKAGKILRAMVVDDWISKGGARPLAANSLDLERLVEFFTMNSPDDSFLSHLEETTVSPYEKVQVMTVLKERGMLRDTYNDLMTQVNSQTSILTEIEMDREAAVTPELKKKLAEKMITVMMSAVMAENESGKIRELSEDTIANQYIRDSLEGNLREMLGTEYETTVAAQLQAIKDEQVRKVEAEKKANLERIAQEREATRQREVAARRMQEMKASFNDRSKTSQIFFSGPSGRSSRAHVSLAPVSGNQWQMFSIRGNVFRVDKLDLKTGKIEEGKPLNGITDAEHIMKITPLSEGKFLLWYGMFGRIFDKETGLSTRKIIYETHNQQMISDNVDNGQLMILDWHRQQVGVAPTSDISDIDWKQMSDFTFQSHPSNSRNSLQYFLRDISAGHVRLYMTGEKGVAHLINENSAFSWPVVYKIDLNTKRIEILGEFPESENRVTKVGWAGTPSASVLNTYSSFFIDDQNNQVDDMRSLEFTRLDLRKFEFNKSRTVQLPNDDIDLLYTQVFDIAPSGGYAIVNSNNSIVGLDFASGEKFPIAMPTSVGTIQRIRFIDDNHVLVIGADHWTIVRLPTAGK